MVKRLLLLMIFGGVFGGAQAQQRPYLPYHARDTAELFRLAQAQRAGLKTHFVVPKGAGSEYREHYRRIVQAAAQDAYNATRYTALLDSVLNPRVQAVFNSIVQANPGLPPVRLLLTRNPEPNAHARGEGTVVLNVGLLARLENESQLAFVLCHELAHTVLRHVDRGLQERLARLHGQDVQSQLRRIIREEYNIESKIKSLALGFSLSTSYHQRRHETQADSLGYRLLTRTRYAAPQAYRALQLLDAVDQPEGAAEPLELARYFSCAAFPRSFAAAPAPARSIFAVAAAQPTALELTDTLKSHPDCAKRMRLVRELAQGQVAEGPQPADAAWERLRQASRLEVVQAWFDYDCYDRALYAALLGLRQQPQNAYLQSVVVLSLYELRQHMQNHKLYEVVSNVSARNPASFNQLLGVLNGLRPADFRELSACFAEATGGPAAGAPTDEYSLAAQYAGLALADEAARAEVARQRYQQQYRGGRFDALLFADSKKTNRK